MSIMKLLPDPICHFGIVRHYFMIGLVVQVINGYSRLLNVVDRFIEMVVRLMRYLITGRYMY